MAEHVSTAGHGPTRGYSGMGKSLDEYLAKHPAHASEQESRSRSLGPRASDFRRRKHLPKMEAPILFNLVRIRNETAELYQFLKWVHGDAAANPWEMPVAK